MDRMIGYIKQYRFVVLILILGMGMMLIPGSKERDLEAPAFDTTDGEQDTEEKLAHILSQIQGVGKTQVMLTVAAGEMTLYERDEDTATGQDHGSVRSEVIIISDEDRKEQGLVQQVLPPTYQGAIIVCQGADRATVRLAVVEAVSNVTGLSADKITVEKMK